MAPKVAHWSADRASDDVARAVTHLHIAATIIDVVLDTGFGNACPHLAEASQAVDRALRAAAECIQLPR